MKMLACTAEDAREALIVSKMDSTAAILLLMLDCD
jgi:hypothetical protein